MSSTPESESQREVSQLIHDLSNHLAVVESFVTSLDMAQFDGDMMRMCINAKRSLKEILELMRNRRP